MKKWLFIISGLSLFLVHCQHGLQQREPASVSHPIEVVYKVQPPKKGAQARYIDLSEYFSVRRSPRLDQDRCYDFVQDFISGRTLLRERQELLNALNQVNAKQNAPKEVLAEFVLHVLEPEKRFHKSGRLYDISGFEVRSTSKPVSQYISCKDFDAIKPAQALVRFRKALVSK